MPSPPGTMMTSHVALLPTCARFLPAGSVARVGNSLEHDTSGAAHDRARFQPRTDIWGEPIDTISPGSR